MKITVDIEDAKVPIFMELLNNLDPIEIGFVTSDLDDELSDEHKKILSERLTAIEKDPSRLIPLDKVLKDLREV